jgi:hydrogenase nickel incorporation protein HypA/HybF
MHEISIAMSIVDVASDALLREGGGRVEVVYLRLGPLSGVIKEALLSAYELACENSPVAGSRLVVEDEPLEIDCPTCGSAQEVESIQEMRCRKCGTFSANIVRGRALEVTAMEIVDEQAAAIG